ncbi:B3 domain-containing protein REM10-like isoform X4 [Macadamia integrifolia]|nr:B3 domain-containing protein REM10-like isoform X4 [Macadamia integrifolia]XP_042493930.1 B3 domain-containing protein REM10-like isoform X4 [Macadamia integrifolia]
MQLCLMLSYQPQHLPPPLMMRMMMMMMMIGDDEWAPLLNLKNNDRIKIRPHHSFFEISLRPFNLKESRLVVPRRFTNWNGLMGKSFTTTLRDGQGRSWKVELKHNIFNRPLYLCGDWAKILALNGLKVGDICKFELIRREKLQVMEFRMV